MSYSNKVGMKTIAEINEKIRKGKAVVVSAEEMPSIVEKNGARKAAEKVDVVTTGTFGAMCSSGAFLNFGHSDPPIKMQKVWLNEVEAYTGIAAVDCYIGATELSLDRGVHYGGAHVIEDLVAGREIKVKAEAYSTDCYPRKDVETTVTLDDLNQAFLFNPRNLYQKYNAATNTSDRTLHTYMGTLLPKNRNVNYSGTGELSPLSNDPNYDIVGFGTRIFLGGAQGYVTGEGTQHNPGSDFATISVKGNLEDMDTKFLRGGSVPEYGTTLYVGIGIPIPILNEKIAKNTAVRNKDIKTNLLDYSVPRLKRPVLKQVSYEELMSGKIKVEGREARSSNLSSMKVAREIAAELEDWIDHKEFFLTEKLQAMPSDSVVKPMKVKTKAASVSRVMTRKVITVQEDETVKKVSEILVKHKVDQIPIVDKNGLLKGIVTTWDITKASAGGKKKLSEIMTRRVITSTANDSIDEVSRSLEKHKINATPVIDGKGKVVGIVTLSDINRFYRRRK